MSTNVELRPLPAAPESAGVPIQRIVDSYRRLSIVLLVASIAVSTLLALVSNVRVASDGASILAGTLAAFLLLSARWWRSAEKSAAADVLGTLSVVSLSGPSCGALAMLGLRMQFPLADNAFRSIDRLVGLDAIAIVQLISRQDPWFFTLTSWAYHYTLPAVGLTMIALSLMKKRREAWRTAFCFISTLLTVCIIAIIMPAKGLGTWASDPVLARLPGCSMRCFWPTFDAFYSGPDPVLGLKTIDGVISFPSFHAVMGAIVVAAWRKNAMTLLLALAWFILMLLGTFPYGGHYCVDLVGGLLVWLFWFAVSRRIEMATHAKQSASVEEHEGNP